ncbi:MAG TPA: DUF2231 domain-containing protein [Jatrophihabitans sp.]|nr:DUF2231 domain-containing protein [Jatrophihabitans sp.]
MPVKVNGLPAHVLLIHVVIVLVPLAALMLVASAVWPAARAKLGFLTPATALVALIFVPITTHAGEWLRDHLQGNQGRLDPLIRKHTQLGDTLLPWAIGLFVVAALVWVAGRRFELSWRSSSTSATGQRAVPVWITAVIAVVAIAVAAGSVVQLYRIGDSGAKADWHGRTVG